MILGSLKSSWPFAYCLKSHHGVRGFCLFRLHHKDSLRKLVVLERYPQPQISKILQVADFRFITQLLFIGTTELLLISGIALLLFGGKKLPEMMRGLGEGVREFKKGVNDAKETGENPNEEIDKNESEENPSKDELKND